MESNKVYVGGLREDATKEEIEDAFNKFGDIEHVWIARKPAGFAFVNFKNADSAADAVRDMNGADLGGQTLKVEMANPKKRRDDRGGERRGGYSDRRDEGRREVYARDDYRDSRRDDYRRDDHRRDPIDSRPADRYDYDRQPRGEYRQPVGYTRRSRSRSHHDDRRYYDRR